MFLMTYFRTQAEALHLALSEDGLNWRALNGNRPTWRASIGRQSVRDPFIFRDVGGTYRLFSTNGWGADSILLADSRDCLSWENERLVPVMQGIAGVRNCWAPECFWDEDEGYYRAIWSSSLDARPLDELEAGADWDHRIWTSSTRDFHSWSAPTRFFDPGHSVIDATVVRLPAPDVSGNKWMMAWKDERGENVPGQQYKRIKTSLARTALGPWENDSEFLTPELSEGPALFWRRDARLGEGWTMFYDLFMGECFGALHSPDGLRWSDISAEVSFPAGPRHASVIEVPDEDAARLEEALGF